MAEGERAADGDTRALPERDSVTELLGDADTKGEAVALAPPGEGDAVPEELVDCDCETLRDAREALPVRLCVEEALVVEEPQGEAPALGEGTREAEAAPVALRPPGGDAVGDADAHTLPLCVELAEAQRVAAGDLDTEDEALALSGGEGEGAREAEPPPVREPTAERVAREADDVGDPEGEACGVRDAEGASGVAVRCRDIEVVPVAHAGALAEAEAGREAEPERDASGALAERAGEVLEVRLALGEREGDAEAAEEREPELEADASAGVAVPVVVSEGLPRAEALAGRERVGDCVEVPLGEGEGESEGEAEAVDEALGRRDAVKEALPVLVALAEPAALARALAEAAAAEGVP
jgi:hypothetical protein